MIQEISPDILQASLPDGSNSDLGLDSTLKELPWYNFCMEIGEKEHKVHTGGDLAKVLEKYPILPGVILLESGKYIGMISRRRLLEFLIRPYGQELFFNQPLAVLYSYARTPILELADTTPILNAMQIVLRREHELLGEPIVVKVAPDIYRLLDVQELSIASWQIRGIETQVRYERSQAQIIQNDKMASLGRLVDGLAHEILDPVGFIWGNLSYVSTYSQDLLRLIAAYSRRLPEDFPEIENLKEEMEFEFLEDDLKKSLLSIRNGAERLKKLVSSLQNFCYIDEVYSKPIDLHACLDSIVLLMNSRIKGEIEIVKNYGKLPPVHCYLGQLNQVFMNILSQAVDTLINEAVRQQFNQESIQKRQKPQIEITTEVISREATNPDVSDSRWVLIRFADNGPGMSQELLQQIIESFSVEKRADKETSLAVSYRIVTARHGGEFHLSSELGRGTEFKIILPLV